MDPIKITNPKHIKLAYEFLGMRQIQQRIELLSEDFPKLPGVGLAAANVNTMVEEARGRMLAFNLHLAIPAGFDPDKESLTMEVVKGELYIKTEATDSEG